MHKTTFAAMALLCFVRPASAGPDTGNALGLLKQGLLLFERGEQERALAYFDATIRLDPEISIAYHDRGVLHHVKQAYKKAIADYEMAFRLDPEGRPSLNNLAALLAACPVDECRNGPRAVELATRLCELSGGGDPTHLDTLASAYAEMGDFPRAIEWQEKALKLFGDGDEKRNGERKLLLYRDRRPYSEEPLAAPRPICPPSEEEQSP